MEIKIEQGIEDFSDEDDYEEELNLSAVDVGLSPLINDHAFKRLGNRGKKFILLYCAMYAAIGFFAVYIICGTSEKINSFEGVVAGATVAALILGRGIFLQIRYIKRKTWDGAITGKKTAKQTRRIFGFPIKTEEFTEYIIEAADKDGKLHEAKYADREDIFNYFNVGDKIRCHGGLKIYEKCDKSADTCVFCSACLEANSLEDDFCSSCNYPLLK